MRVWTDDEITGLGSADADIRVPGQVDSQVQRHRPDWVVLSAAYTDVDGCELNPQLATAVNTAKGANRRTPMCLRNCRWNLRSIPSARRAAVFTVRNGPFVRSIRQ